MKAIQCSIDGCERPKRKRAWCDMHYNRWRKHGDPLTCRPKSGFTLTEDHRAKISAATTGRIVSAEARAKIGAASKGRKASDETRAKLSAARMGHPTSIETRRKIGEANAGNRLVEIAYRSAHSRVTKQRGKASEHPCQIHGDGKPARDWAYDHCDPDARVAGGMPYSLDVNHYIPLCRPCHVRMDRTTLPLAS